VVADAGQNRSVKALQSLEIDGSVSSGPVDGFRPLYYSWICVEGGVAIVRANTPFPTVVAPPFIEPVPGEDDPNKYTMRLTVTLPDADGFPSNITDTDEMTVTVTSDSGGGGGSSCFIATAAYGSNDTSHLFILRSFRDECLLTNLLGRSFVAMYYHLSPPIASVIAEHETLRSFVRVALLPLVGFARVSLHIAPIMNLLVVMGVVSLLALTILFRRTRRQAQC